MLQTDSHARFAPGWDRALIEMLDSIEDTKALLTAYAPGYVSRSDGSDERARPASGAPHSSGSTPT